MVIKIKDKFEIDSRTTLGRDNKGMLYCRCEKCNKSMLNMGMKPVNGVLNNVYYCPECKKTRKIPRHW